MIGILSVATSIAVAVLAYVGSRQIARALIAGIVAFGLITVVPFVFIAFLSYLGGLDWRNDPVAYAGLAVLAANVAAWMWLAAMMCRQSDAG